MPSLKNILIVDDNRVNRRILGKILGGEYHVLEAENGQEALSVLRENDESISVVLLDIVMPVLDGYEVLRRMRADPLLSKIPVIVESGQNTEDAEVKALSLGANDYILKPYKPEIIRHRVANTIFLKETSAFFNSVQHDALTGLYGKDYFYLKVGETLRNNPQKKYDLICFDIDRFKLVNDMYGMPLGDDLLKHVGRLLQEGMRGNGFCGRLGADEFACLTPHREDYQKKFFTDSIERINAFSDVIKLNLVLRYGIYTIEDPTTPVNIMCDRAILAKESIKGKYDTYFAYYDDKIRQKLLDEQMIVSDMKTALAENQFKVYFQPKYDLKTEEIVGAEALVRWIHPVKGFLSPGEFIPLFERNGFITDLDLYIWDQCCQKMRAWIDAGNTATPLSINVSRADLYDPNLPQMMIAMIQKYRLSPKDLHLEITESAYTENPEQLIAAVCRMKKLGFIIEMDDFGTGYSSLNMLSELPIDILKLDMRFIQKEEKKHRDRSVLSFIISLAKWMNLKVVAEGIETEAQVQLLQSLNCEYAQGYYYAKPLPQDQFEQHLLQSKLQTPDAGRKGDPFSRQGNADYRKIMLMLDEQMVDFPLVQKEYANIYRVERACQVREALAFLERTADDVCALVISLPAAMGPNEVSELTEACKKINVPVLVLYDREDPLAEEILKLDISDYTARPYEFRQLNLRLKNAVAYARMEKFEHEKEINAAMIEMRKRAELDALTGLFNRAEYEMRIDHFFLENDDPQGIFIILDVDNFKAVNDNFGHVIGDRVLGAVGEHLKKIFPETEMIGRIGGDEFSVFIPYLLSEPQLQEKMRTLCGGIFLDAESVCISCSAGICYSPRYGSNHKDLYQNADIALIAAKRNGKSQFETFAPGMELPQTSVLEQKTMQLLDHTSDAMFVCDAVTSAILYINETACEILKRDRKSCLGQRCYELFWDQCRNCDRCEAIDLYEQDFYEETTFLKDQKTPVHLKARLEDWEGRKMKVHYLQVGSHVSGGGRG